MATLQELLDAYTREPWNPARREAIDSFVRDQDENARLRMAERPAHAGKRAKITYETPTFDTIVPPQDRDRSPGSPPSVERGRRWFGLAKREPIFRSNITRTTRLPGAGFQPEGQDPMNLPVNLGGYPDHPGPLFGDLTPEEERDRHIAATYRQGERVLADEHLHMQETFAQEREATQRRRAQRRLEANRLAAQRRLDSSIDAPRGVGVGRGGAGPAEFPTFGGALPEPEPDLFQLLGGSDMETHGVSQSDLDRTDPDAPSRTPGSVLGVPTGAGDGSPGVDAFGFDVNDPPPPPMPRTLPSPLPAEGRVRPEGIGPETLQDILSIDDRNAARRRQMQFGDPDWSEDPWARRQRLHDVGREAQEEFAHLTEPLTPEELAAGKRLDMMGQGDFGDTKTPRFAANMQRRWDELNGEIAELARGGYPVPKYLLDERKRYESFLKENPRTRAFMESGGTQGEIGRVGARSRFRSVANRPMSQGGGLYGVLADPATQARRDELMTVTDPETGEVYTRSRPGSDDGFSTSGRRPMRVDLSTVNRRKVDPARRARANANLAKAEERAARGTMSEADWAALSDDGREAKRGELRERRREQSARNKVFRSARRDAVRAGGDIHREDRDLPEDGKKFFESLGYSETEWNSFTPSQRRALMRNVRRSHRKAADRRRAQNRNKPWQQVQMEEEERRCGTRVDHRWRRRGGQGS